MTERELYQSYVDANRAFWDAHDRLVSQGFFKLDDLRGHPDYVTADVACSTAFEAWLKERQGGKR